jgi:PAS domain S-box-containing protein
VSEPARAGEGTILVVDDNEANRYAVAYWLREAGFHITEAASGEEAMRLAAEHPDLMILDIKLPDRSGFDVLRSLKEDPALAQIPVLHISASFTTSQWRTHGLELGADGFLTHPVEPAELVATVRSLLRARRAEERVWVAAQEWQATFDAIPDGVFLVDDDGRLLRGNVAGAQLVGVPLARVTGRPLAEVLRDALGEEVGRALVDLGGIAAPWRRQARGRDRWFSVEAAPVRAQPRAADGALPGAVCIVSDITERAELLAREQRARHEAEEANRAKSEFLAMMSHELRTPLNAISGYVELLQMGIAGPTSQGQLEYLSRLKNSQEHLLRLINTVLNFARLEAGHIDLDVADVLVDDLLVAVEPLVRPQLQLKQLRYECIAAGSGVRVRADPDKVAQILLNLASNAVKFTPAGGRITLRARADGDVVRVEVEDTGQGVPADKLERIFDAFVQVDQRLTRQHGGVGLGLAISRDLARAMGGDLMAASAVGHGSTFTLTLPRAVPRQAPALPTDAAATGWT